VRNETGESYREFLMALAQESGIATPTAEDLAKFDRKRKGKKCSNDDWHSPNEPDAKIAKMKDGTTHLAHKNEHAVDLDTGAIVAPAVHPADEGDPTTLMGTLEQACTSLQEVREDETVQADTSSLYVQDVVTDKGYHSGQTLVNLEEVDLRGYVSEPDRGRRNWTARSAADQASKRAEQAAVYRNRRRRKGNRSKRLHRQRAELVERSFEHVLDDGGMRRVHLRGRANIAKRYLIHTAAFNLGLIMRKLTGFGTPKGWADARRACFARVRGVWTALERCWDALCRHRAAFGLDQMNRLALRYAA
jgi:transposase